MRGNCLAASNRVDSLVGLAFDTDARGVDAQRTGDRAAHGVDVIADFRLLENDGDIDVADLVSEAVDERDGAPQQIDARRILPRWVGVGKMRADVAEADRPEYRDRKSTRLNSSHIP